MVRGNDWTSSCASAASFDCEASAANITTYVRSLAPPGVSSSNIAVTPSWPQQTVSGSSTGCGTSATQNSQGCLVKVNLSYAFKFFLPFLPKSGFTMTATSEQVIAY